MVAKITRPQIISGAFASQSDNKNVIPNAPTGTYNASMADGFPNITMIPKGLGGTPPDGADFNGILNLVTQFYYQFQSPVHIPCHGIRSSAPGTCTEHGLALQKNSGRRPYIPASIRKQRLRDRRPLHTEGKQKEDGFHQE